MNEDKDKVIYTFIRHKDRHGTK